MTLLEREAFAHEAAILRQKHKADLRYISITVRKENVQEHIRLDSNKLYNYMIGLSLLNEMHRHREVVFIPDPRSVKVASGNSLHDYLQTQLWFEKQTNTLLETIPADSSSNYNIQFADMLSGLQSEISSGIFFGVKFSGGGVSEIATTGPDRVTGGVNFLRGGTRHGDGRALIIHFKRSYPDLCSSPGSLIPSGKNSRSVWLYQVCQSSAALSPAWSLSNAKIINGIFLSMAAVA
jgi:hypothetical protein